MKNSVRIRIALDMCVREKKKFILSIFVLSIAFALILVNLYIVFSANSYMHKVQKGLKIPVEKLIWFSFELEDYKDNQNIYEELLKTSGVSTIGNISTGLSNTRPELAFLRNTQINGKKYANDSNYLMHQNINVNVITAGMWDVVNLELISGKAPYEYEVDEIDVLLYFSEEYMEVVEVGQELCFKEDSFRYIVAGFISGNSTMMDDTFFSDEQITYAGFHSMEYGIIEVMQSKYISGYGVLENDYETVINQFNEIAKKYNSRLEIYSIDSVIDVAEKKAANSSFYLNEIMVILVVLAIISVLAIQIFEMLIHADEYGIWLACKATKKDLIIITCIQNFIRTFVAVAFSVLIVYLILISIYGASVEMKMLTKDIYVIYCFPIIVLIGIMMVALESVIPSLILNRAGVVNLLKGELNK